MLISTSEPRRRRLQRSIDPSRCRKPRCLGHLPVRHPTNLTNKVQYPIVHLCLFLLEYRTRLRLMHLLSLVNHLPQRVPAHSKLPERNWKMIQHCRLRGCRTLRNGRAGPDRSIKNLGFLPCLGPVRPQTRRRMVKKRRKILLRRKSTLHMVNYTVGNPQQ